MRDLFWAGPPLSHREIGIGIPLEEFCAKRSAFIASLLALPSLYFSPKGKDTLEAQVAPRHRGNC